MIAELVLLGAIWFHLWLCPYTKVEESFNMQAFHDILYRGVQDIKEYDHHTFPGVVPRTFVGSLLVSGISYPFLYLARMVELPDKLGISEKFMCQYLVRAVLGYLVFFSFMRFKSAVSRVFGYPVARWFLLISATQFHVVFYSSRSLPNTFALVLSLVAIAYYIDQKHPMFVITATIAMVIFRGELALLFGPFILMELVQRRLSLVQLISYGVGAAIFSLGLTVGIDSYFWRRWVWPEGEVLWFNTILNKSSNWGTSPFLWYFYSAIPRSLMTSLFFIPIGAYLDTRARRLATIALIFVILFSNLPHKELRFIFYALPLLNLASAVGCDRIIKNRHKSLAWLLISVLCMWQLVLNLVGTGFFLVISQDNYPGASALNLLHDIRHNETGITVHIDPYSAQTGITQFMYKDGWTYDKSEHLLPTSLRMEKIEYAIGMGRENSANYWNKTHALVAEVFAYDNVTFDVNALPPLEINRGVMAEVYKNRKFLKVTYKTETISQQIIS